MYDDLLWAMGRDDIGFPYSCSIVNDKKRQGPETVIRRRLCPIGKIENRIGKRGIKKFQEPKLQQND